MLGIIRVLTTENQAILKEHGHRMEQLYGVESITHCIEDQSSGIFDNESESIAVPKIVRLAEAMHQTYKLEAITISCAADPALEETRNSVNLPILGAGVCGAHAAAMVGSKVGILGITEEPPVRMIEELGERYFCSTFSPKLRKTTDLFEKDAKKELLKMTNDMIGQGADVILFACTGFSTIRLKEYLGEYIHIPIIDLVEAQAIAFQLISRRKAE